jgi:hypothetical protein
MEWTDQTDQQMILYMRNTKPFLFSSYSLYLIMEFKLTPFVLFFIILLVLVISIVFMKNVNNEGFIDFYYSSSPTDASSVLVPIYSTNYPISKLYDNLYFDKRNANLVALNGPYTGTSSTDAKTLSSIAILTRNNSQYNSVVNYTNPTTNITNYDSVESKVTSITENYKLMNLYTGMPSPYAVFYFAWNKDTYLHVIDISNNTNNRHMVSYYINGSSAVTTYDFSSNTPTHIYPRIQTKSTAVDASNSSVLLLNTTVPVYDLSKNVYQLDTNVYYDNLRGYVICTTPPATSGGSRTISNIYDYTGTDIYNAATSASLPGGATTSARINALTGSVNQFTNVSTFTSSVVTASTDTSNNVLIMSNGNKKIIALFSNGSAGGNTPIVRNYMKFNGALIDTSVTPSASGTTPPASGTTPPASETTPPASVTMPIDSSNVYSEYMKWYTYWNSVGQPGNKGFSDDYLLKTQIVPPVCPACNSVGGCQNCNAGGSAYGAGGSGTAGGAGGAGGEPGTLIAKTDGTSGSVIATSGKQITTVDRGGALASTADPDTLGGSLTLGQLSFVAGLQDVGHVVGDTTTNAVNKVGEGVGAVGQGIGSAGSGIYNTVNAAGQGIYSAGAGIGGAIKDTGSYLGGALNKVGSTAYEAGKYVGTGVGNTLADDVRYGGGRTGNIHDAGYKDNYYDPSRQAYNNSYRGDRGATTNAPGQYTGTAIDNYSYYGALQSKGGNFMPLTSDFSKFGR